MQAARFSEHKLAKIIQSEDAYIQSCAFSTASKQEKGVENLRGSLGEHIFSFPNVTQRCAFNSSQAGFPIL